MIDKYGDQLSDTIRSGDVQAVRALIQAMPELIRKPWRGFFPWLTIATEEKSVEMVEYLISLGLDVNEKELDIEGGWPLEAAVNQDNVDMVRVLLDHGANPDIGRDVIGAIVGDKRHSLEMVKLLHQHGANLHRVFRNAITGGTMNALGEAVNWGKEDVAEYLRTQGCVMPPDEMPPEPEDTLEAEIVAYFEEHFGPVRREAIIEIVPTEPRIAVHVIPPDSVRRHVTLFTIGVSIIP